MPDAQIEFHALSHRGMVRAENQDHVFGGKISRTEERYLFAVADGVGGREGGAWASERALQLLLEEISAQNVGFQAAIMAANRTVYEEASRNRERRGAATTLVAALVEGSSFTWANVGDSRLYILRDGDLHQLSRDHSLVEEELAAGRITPEEAAHSTYRNVITRSIGNQPAVDVDSEGPFQLEPGDILLLCSDGLHQLVTSSEMIEHAVSMTPAEATDALIRLANQRGGPDNVSVVIFAFQPQRPATDTKRLPVPPSEEHTTQRLPATAAPDPAPEPQQAPPAPEPPQPPRQEQQPAPQRREQQPPAPPLRQPRHEPVAAPTRQDDPPAQSSGPSVRLIGFGICAGATIGLLIGVFLKPF